MELFVQGTPGSNAVAVPDPVSEVDLMRGSVLSK
jgi:hypothetical protein